MNRFLCLFLIACSMDWTLEAAPDKRKENTSIPSAVMYALPQTVLDVEVIAEKTIVKRGPFADYAYKFLGIQDDVVQESGEVWRINSLKLNSHPEVDPQQFYSIISSGDYKSNLINLSPEGLIKGFNLGVPMKTAVKQVEENILKDEELEIEYGLFSIDPLLEVYQDTTYKMVEKDTTFVKIPVLKNQFEAKTLEEKAAEAAHQIFKLRKRRFKILTSNFEVLPPDGKAYEVIVRELAELEANYISLFIGKRLSVKKIFHFSYLPLMGKDDGVLFRFSTDKGVVDKRDLSGIPVMIELKNLKVVGKVADTPGYEAASPVSQMVYRIPGQARVRIVKEKDVLLDKKMIIAQFGKLSSVPIDVLLNEGYRIDFHYQYGSIRSIYK